MIINDLNCPLCRKGLEWALTEVRADGHYTRYEGKCCGYNLKLDVLLTITGWEPYNYNYTEEVDIKPIELSEADKKSGEARKRVREEVIKGCSAEKLKDLIRCRI